MSEFVQVFLMTADLERSRQFYEQGLDLNPRRVGDTSVSYETGQCELKLQADFPPETLESYNIRAPEDPRGDGAIQVIAVTGSLKATYEQIAALDDETGRTLTEPTEVPWGGRMFLAQDPNGYTFEVRQVDGSGG